MQLTPEQRRHIFDWPGEFYHKLAAKCNLKLGDLREWLESLGPIPWWSDCAGGNMACFAARQLGITVDEEVACDNSAGPQKFILRNHRPRDFVADLIGRDHRSHGNKGGP